jgi:hypothetical protein
LIKVHFARSDWVLFFLPHWSFVAEMALIVTAPILFLRRKKV